MTVDIRTAAQREAERRLPGDFSSHLAATKAGFIEGAVWGAARVTPTREQISKVLYFQRVSDNAASTAPEISKLCDEAADAILALMQGLTEGETGTA